MQLNGLSPLNPLIPSPFNNTIQMNPNPIVPQTTSLNLTQIEGFAPVERFTDDANTEWILAKAASNSTVGIPDPKAVQIVDFWNHKFPRNDLSQDIYIYVVEGVKQPTVETEQPTRVLYQWFSTTVVYNFTPQMITGKEWLKANVYSAPVADSRVSKLKALCKVSEVYSDKSSGSAEDQPLIHMKELRDGGTNSKGNKGKD